MDHERFREWFSHVDELTTAQCKEVAAVLSDPRWAQPRWRRSSWAWMMSGAVRIAPAPGRCRRHAVFAAIGARPAGRHSAHSRARRCRACTIRSAGWPSAPRAQARRSERLPCGIAPSTAHRWRHRFLAAVRQAPESSRRTRPSFSRAGRGSGSWIASRAGAAARPGGLSREQVPILRRSRRRDPQPHLARPQRKEREGGAGAGRRPRCLARLRRQPLLSACRSGAPSREHQRRRRRAGSRRPAHPDGQQPARSRASCRGIATKYGCLKASKNSAIADGRIVPGRRPGRWIRDRRWFSQTVDDGAVHVGPAGGRSLAAAIERRG